MGSYINYESIRQKYVRVYHGRSFWTRESRRRRMLLQQVGRPKNRLRDVPSIGPWRSLQHGLDLNLPWDEALPNHSSSPHLFGQQQMRSYYALLLQVSIVADPDKTKCPPPGPTC